MRFVLFLAATASLLAQDVIHLKSRDRITGAGRDAYLSTPLRRLEAGRSHYLVRLDPESIEALTAAGGRLLRSAGGDAVVLSAPDDLNWREMPVRWTGRLDAADKVSPVAPPATAFVVEFHPDVAAEDAAEILRQHNLPASPGERLLPGQIVVETEFARVVRLAEWDEVAYIFPASEDLRRGVPVAGCPGAVHDRLLVGQYSQFGAGWPMRDGELPLDWSIASLTSKVPALTAKSEIARALHEWAKYAPIRWTQTATPDALRTIKITFRAMDGPGLTLAETFYPAPPNPEPVAGDMHFDAAETWAVGRTLDLYSVVLHEAGHALGLGHSDDPGAVMYPYYRQASGLSIDDINGLRDLYPGSPALPPVDPTPQPPIPVPLPPIPPPPSPAPATDTAPPTLSITTPSTTVTSTRSASIAFGGTSRDNVEVAQVTWETSAGDSGIALGTAFWSASIPLRIGLNYITIRAFDSAGNQSWRAIRVTRY